MDGNNLKAPNQHPNNHGYLSGGGASLFSRIHARNGK